MDAQTEPHDLERLGSSPNQVEMGVKFLAGLVDGAKRCPGEFQLPAGLEGLDRILAEAARIDVVDASTFINEQGPLQTYIRIEDEIIQIDSLKNNKINVVIPDQPWNQHFSIDSSHLEKKRGRIVRVYTWREAFKSVEEMLEK